MAHNPEGHSVAAWTAVIIMFIATIIGGVALVVAQWWLFWISCGLFVVGAIVGKVLSVMGFGNEPARRYDPAELTPHTRTR